MKLTAESTVLDDKKIGDSFATLQVEADGIRTEVGTKVGNNEVISRINQSAESVKIQADKINIDGVITAVNDNTTTTIDGDKITTGTLLASAVKADSGTFNTANIPNLSSEKITVGSQTLTTALNGKAASGAENTANNYITDIGSDGIRVHDSHTSNNSIVINSDGMEVFKGGTAAANSVASFGADGVRVGKIQDPHIEFGSTSSNFYGNNQALVGKITSGEEGISTYTNSAFVGSSTITGRGVIDSVPKTLYDAELWYKPETDISVSYNIDGTNYTKTISKSTDSDQTVNGMRFKYTVATNKLLIQCVKNPFTLSYEVNSDTRYPNASDSRCATYDYNSSNKRGVLTLNYTPVTGTAIKVTEGIVGTFSFTAGTSQTLTRTSVGTTVTAVYNATNKTVTLTATGTLTKPTFDSVTYTIKCANVGGVDLTFDRKYWKPQFSFGLDNTMNEYGFANAFGQGLIIGAEHQTVLGKYNTQLTDALFIIGKGSNSSTRSNAAFVTTAGNMTIAGRLTQSSDRRLKEHISYLDSDADDFIRDLKPAHYTKDNAKHVGFYAQDVEEADKWDCMVGEMNGYKTLGYTELIAPLVAYCQHLEKRIEALERTIK